MKNHLFRLYLSNLRWRLRSVKGPACWMAAVLLFYVLFSLWGWGASAEFWLLDSFFRARGVVRPPPEVVLVSIDEETFSKLNVSILKPLPRALFAPFLRSLWKHKPAAVLLDFLFQEALDPQTDSDLAAALTLGPTFIMEHQTQRMRPDAEGVRRLVTHMNRPLALFADAAAGVISANVYWERDGVVRRFPRTPDVEEYKIPLAAVARAANPDLGSLPRRHDFINFYGPTGSLFTVPFYKLLDKEDPAAGSLFKGKLVVVGRALFSTPEVALSETFATPFRLPTFGVEIHGTVAANLLRQDWIHRAAPGQEALWTIFALGILSYLLLRLSPLKRALLGGALVLAAVALSYCLFLRGRFMPAALPVALLLTMLVVSFLVMLGKRLFGEWWIFRPKKREPPEEPLEADTRGRFKPGELISGRYRVLAKLGAGAMGEVYRVSDQKEGDRVVALKALFAGFGRESREWIRFRNEAMLACEFSHPNIAKGFEFTVDESGLCFLSMEYVRGESLKRRVPLPLPEAARILCCLARGLAYAHERGVVHRDVKPDNVLLGADGAVKLTDFGVARLMSDGERLTMVQERVGTCAYMAPEQFEGKDSDHRADIYALGILAFEMCEGRPPFEHDSVVMLAKMHRERALPEFGIKQPGWFRSLVEGCTQKDPKHRIQSMSEVVGILEEALAKLA